MTKTTTITRISKRLDKELKLNFPNIERSKLLDVMYRTSAIRAEVWLKSPNKTLNEITKKNKKK